jgi:hypothetical protein
MFQGLGNAEKRLFLIIKPGVPLTVTDARNAYPATDHKTHRQAMQSLARKGFVQVMPGPVFAIGTRPALVEAPVPRPVAAPPPVPRSVAAPPPVPRVALAVASKPLEPVPSTGSGQAFASAADEYAARVAREVERKKEAAMKTQRTVI